MILLGHLAPLNKLPLSNSEIAAVRSGKYPKKSHPAGRFFLGPGNSTFTTLTLKKQDLSFFVQKELDISQEILVG